MAETVNNAYKTELIRRRGPWKTIEEVEVATLEWVHWYNHERLHQTLNYKTPAEHETALTGTSNISEIATLALATT